MNRAVLVSVVVPVYNVEKYVEKCINSIINQSYNNLEIIVVDDGSKDSSASMCDKIAMRDSRVKVYHKHNEGLGLTRNYGMNRASGKYIMFVDSDDYIEENIIERMLKKNPTLPYSLWGPRIIPYTHHNRKNANIIKS